MDAIDRIILIPPRYESTSIRREEARFIHVFLREKKIIRTIEVGLAWGYSAAHIIDATGSAHVAIDPFQECDFYNIGLQNIQMLGFGDKLDFRAGPSQLAMPNMLQEGKKFQFIFIDGGHRFDDVFVDWHFSDKLLEERGYILFHDPLMKSVALVARFIRKNRLDYEEIPTGVENLVMFQKVGRDMRKWDHFEEF